MFFMYLNKKKRFLKRYVWKKQKYVNVNRGEGVVVILNCFVGEK